MKIGKYELNFLNSGYFKLDGGAMFGIIPRPLWEKTAPPDDKNRINLATRNILLQNGKRKILIDSGMGSKWDEKSQKIYAVNQEQHSLIKELSRFNLTPDEITDVILTHLHFDHTGGSTKIENGKVIPVFSNARYYVQKKNFEWARNPSDRDKGSYIKENFLPLAGEGVLTLIDGEKDFDNEIELVAADGHTFGQQLVKIYDSENTFFFCGDLIPTSAHIPIPYVMGYDLQPLVTVKEKKKILAQAAEENWKLVFEHDPEVSYAVVSAGEKGYNIIEKCNSI